MSSKTTLPPRLVTLRTVSPIVGIFGIGVGLAMSFAVGIGIDGFFHATLYAFWMILGLTLGSFALLMIHHMTHGAWSFVAQRVFEALARSWPVPLGMFALIWLGTWLGWHDMYTPWIHPISEVVEKKTVYLNLPFWSGRALLYFVIWIGMILMFDRWSRRLEATGDAMITLNFRRVAPPALIVYCLTMTFAALDWGQSLEPEWFSTMYAPLTWISQGLMVFPVAILVLAQFRDEKPLSRYLTVDHFHALGTLMFAFIVLWAYMAFGQFLIIWSGNLPEEISYYLDRMGSPFYNVMTFLLMVGHFFVPFMYLLQRRFKFNVSTLCAACWWVLAMRLVDVFFWIDPAFHHGDTSVPWRDIIVFGLVFAGYAGFYFWYFFAELTRLPMLPMKDPRMYEALEPSRHHEVPYEEVMDHG